MEQPISISDTQHIISELSKTLDYDLSVFSPYPLRNIFSSNYQKCNASDINQYIFKISNDRYFQSLFLQELNIFETEFFRDITFWNTLYETILPKLKNRFDRINIFLPVSNTGEELFSLIIILKELNIFEKCEIHVSCLNKKTAENISNGLADKKKLTICKKNLEESKLVINLDQYFISKSCHDVFIDKITDNIHLEVSFFDHFPEKDFHFVLLRNKLMFLSEQAHLFVINKIDKTLIQGGFLALGCKENILDTEIAKKYEEAVSTEKIYRKIG